MVFLSFWLLASCLANAWALQANQAGVVDWHKSFIGVPKTSFLSTAPAFHRIGGANESTQSVILTATANNVLAALHPVDGSVAWRHIFATEDRILGLKAHGDVVSAISGPGGATFRAFDVLNGDLIVEKQLHHPAEGHLVDPEILSTAISYTHDGDVIVLSDGHVVRRLDSNTGVVKWSWTSPDEASLIIYSKLSVTSTEIYVLGLAKSLASFTLHASVLSSTTGELLESQNVPSSIQGGLADFLLLSNDKQPLVFPHAVWFEAGSVRVMKLTPELREKPSASKGAVYQRVMDVGLSEHGQFVGIKEDGTGHAFRLNEDGLKAVWEFKDSATSPHYAESHYTAGLDKDGWPYIARVFWSHVLKQASAHIYASHLGEGKGLVMGYTFPFKSNAHGLISHVAVDAANPDVMQIASRLLLTTSTGAVQLWQQGSLQWTREEALADIRVAEMVELPERKVITSLMHEEEQTFSERLSRQLYEARDFPTYAANFVKRFVTGSYASASSSVVPSSDSSELLARDTFGFRKIIVAATAYGKVYGIDSANGEIVWSRVFGLGWAAQVGGEVLPVKLFVTRTVNDGESAQVAVVTQRRARNTLVDTVLFHVDALTGTDALGKSPDGGVLEGLDVIAGPLVDAYLLRHGDAKIVVLLDEFVQAHIFPDTPSATATFHALLPSLHLALRTGTLGAEKLTGHQVYAIEELNGRPVAQPVWTTPLPPGERILSVTPKPAHTPVASLGKVLGNRTTLYKYLNPNLLAVASEARAQGYCALRLVDGAKGTVVYDVVLPMDGGGCDVEVVLAENWLVYLYYDGDAPGSDQSKGWRVVSVEMYEGAGVDGKTRSSDASSLSNATRAITFFEESYVFPRGVTAVATTSTSYGITLNDIIVASENFQIQSFPRRFLDPRRPHRKPTSEEMEEWLMQYDPLIPDDPKRVLSHNYSVAQTKRILTSPALIESTSLVFAYGLDLFFTRVAPSGTFDVLSEGFNKVQLIFTVSGLALGIVIARPMMGRKRLRERWYD